MDDNTKEIEEVRKEITQLKNGLGVLNRERTERIIRFLERYIVYLEEEDEEDDWDDDDDWEDDDDEDDDWDE